MRTAPLPRDGNHETIYAASSVVSIQNVALNTSTFAYVTAPSIYAKSLLAKTASGEECYISNNGGSNLPSPAFVTDGNYSSYISNV